VAVRNAFSELKYPKAPESTLEALF